MKSPRPFRLLGVYASVFLLLQSLATVFAQSPDNIAGTTFDLQITDGRSPFASSGRYLLLMNGPSDYVSYNVSGVADSEGSYLYQRTAFDSGRINFPDFSYGNFLFTTRTNGRFSMGLPSSLSYQNGNFKVYSGTAPSSIARKIIRVQSSGGNLSFGGGGTYRILTTSDSAYAVQNSSGTVVHTGTYTYSRDNRVSGVFRFQDTVHAGGFLVLTFDAGNTGLSLVRKNASQLFQVGAFAVLELRPPVFSSHPTSRNIAVGTATTFSASATGTGPITYQWYKGSEQIGGATGSSYTIPSVQLWDAGNYRVVASSAAGSVSSESATLVPVCGYSLSKNALFVDFRGGNRSITVFATGTCPWTASNTNTWITITSAAAGQGNAALSLMVEANESDTPRTGSLQVAGKSLVIAQGARFAQPEIAGKTFRLDYDGALFPQLMIVGSGTNQQVQLVSFDTNTPIQTVDYNYSVTSSSNAVMQLGSGLLSLTFNTAKTGTMIFTNLAEGGEAFGGTFTMNSSSPDFNEDGRGDLVLQGTSGGFAAWHMRNTNFLNARLLRDGIPPNGGARGFGSADFNQDGHSDLVLQDTAGRLVVWFMQGTNRIGGMILRPGVMASGWRAFSVADVNGDGHPDILFQNKADRRLSAWLFNGTTFQGGLPIRNGQPAAAGWRAVGAADLNGDAQTDVLLQHDSGKIAAWFLNGGQFATFEYLRDGVAAAKWKVMGIGDVNEDGSADILWQNDKNQVATWLFQGKEFVQPMFLRDGKAAGSGWRVVAPR